MELTAFLMENVETELTEEVLISKRFKDANGEPLPFEIKAITSKRDNQLTKASEKKEVNNGKVSVYTDYEEYVFRLVAECTTFPNFKSKELQESWQVLGADKLISKMLLPGELAELAKRIQKLNGFGTIEELKEEVKEPLTEETDQ